METPRRKKQTTENFIKDVRRKTRRVFSSDQEIKGPSVDLRSHFLFLDYTLKSDFIFSLK